MVLFIVDVYHDNCLGSGSMGNFDLGDGVDASLTKSFSTSALLGIGTAPFIEHESHLVSLNVDFLHFMLLCNSSVTGFLDSES